MNVVIVPVLNDQTNPVGADLRASLKPWQNRLQILFVDGGSSDNTVAALRGEGFEVLSTDAQSRGRRMQLGVEATVSEMILFHHPRSVLDQEALQWFARAEIKDGWGAFTHQFDDPHPFLKFTSWYSNRVRGARGIFYLDHCIFTPRTWLVAAGGVPGIEIFEDTELSKRLRQKGTPRILPFKSVTSSVRFARNGYIRQGLLNQWLKVRYYLRASDQEMNKHYEDGLELNTVVNRKGKPLGKDS